MKRWGIDSVESWMVAVAISLEILLISWPERVRGQIFLTMLEYFQISKKSASFPFSFAFCMRSISGPFVGFFGKKYGLKEVTLFGCFLSSLGIFGCFFARDILEVDILLGFVYGIGFGIATCLSPEIINEFFRKHRAKANGITFAGSALGGFLTPPLMEILIYEYKLSGTFLIMGAMLLNTIPLMMFVRKPTSGSKIHRERVVTLSNSNEKRDEDSNEDDNTHSADIHVHENKQMIKKIDPGASYSKSCFELEGKFLKSEKTYLLSDFKHAQNYSGQPESEQHLMDDCKLEITESEEESELVELERSIDSKGNVVLDDDIINNTEDSSVLSSFRVLCSPVFIFVALIQSSHFYVEYIVWTIIVDVAMEKEVEEHLAKYFVMGLSLSDMIGRVALGFLTDNLYMSRATYCAICFVIMALTCAVLPWVSDFILAMALICLLGFICGANTTGLPGLVTKFIRKKERTMAMSSRLILLAPMTFTLPYFLEYFKENLGSYDGLFYVLTALCAFCAILLQLSSRFSCHRTCCQNN